MLLVVYFTGCQPESAPLDTVEAAWERPLASPAVAVASPNAVDAFKSTCSVNVVLNDTNGNTVASMPIIPFKGGRWSGTPIEVGMQLVATMDWVDCENTDDGTGTFTSSTFSGEAGHWFVLHYDGVDAGFEWLVQQVDFEGGSAHVQLAEAATEDEIVAFAESIGVSVAADDADANFRYLAWSDDTSVSSVLVNASASEVVGWCEPTWIEKPAWW